MTRGLKKIYERFNTFAQKMIKEKNSINKSNLADSPPEKQQQWR